MFQNKTDIEIIGFQLMNFGFALGSSDIDLLNMDLLNQRFTHLDLLDTDIPDKSFVCFQDVLKTSSRRLMRCLKDVLEEEKLLR